MQQNKKWL